MRFKQVHRFNKKRRTPEKRLPGTAIAVENGNVDKAIRKLKKKLQKEDMFNELRKREYYETRNERKRKEKAASTRRCIRKKEKLGKLEV
jgi:small subunit ribosomal protein S21|tara:strand:- start:374 stop:640 length:267 start_codon:yes stop_codon:yes gene_type:complete